jgi:glycosyltransferase involved in cell wall biosynthesis
LSKGVREAIDFKGSISSKRVSELMQISDIFALASISEGSPKVIIEALASGLPIAATSVGDIPALVRNGGYCCPPQDPKSLSKSMSKCLDLTKNMSREDLAKLVQHKSWSSVSRELEVKYKQLIDLG